MLRLAASVCPFVMYCIAEVDVLVPDASAHLAMLQRTASLHVMSESKEDDTESRLGFGCPEGVDCDVAGSQLHGQLKAPKPVTQALLSGEVEDDGPDDCQQFQSTDAGNCDCPAGSHPIQNPTECQKATGCHGLKMFERNSKSSTAPAGCFSQLGKGKFKAEGSMIFCGLTVKVYCKVTSTVPPTGAPTAEQSPSPTKGPTVKHTPSPTAGPTAKPSPTKSPTAKPSPSTTSGPAAKPSPSPTKGPTAKTSATAGPKNAPHPRNEPTPAPRSKLKFTVLPDEYLTPACSTDVERLTSLGKTNTSGECEEKVVAAAHANENVNFGVWRGDANKECYTCMARKSRFEIDYSESRGVVSFAKQAVCSALCQQHTSNWHTKCRWESRICSACSVCEHATCTGPGCPRCETYCASKTHPWEKKCGWPSKDCRGCNHCNHIVALGVYTLRSVSSLLCLVASTADGLLGLSSKCTVGTGRWRLSLNLTSGLYTLLNLETGKYLGSEGGTNVSETATDSDLAARWRVELSIGHKYSSFRTFTLQSSATLKYLTASASLNITIGRLGPLGDLTKLWILDQISEDVDEPHPTTESGHGALPTPSVTTSPTASQTRRTTPPPSASATPPATQPPTPMATRQRAPVTTEPSPPTQSQPHAPAQQAPLKRMAAPVVGHTVSAAQLDFCNAKLAHNNIGGLGPDGGDKSMVYSGITVDNAVSMIVTNVSVYTPWNTSINGLHGSLNCIGGFSLKCGEQVTLRFSFVDSATRKPTMMTRFNFTVLDIDAGIAGRCRESVEVSDYSAYSLSFGSTVVEENDMGTVRFKASVEGTGQDDPTDFAALTATQKARAVNFLFMDVQTFTLTFFTNTDQNGSIDPRVVGYAGRKLLWTAGASIAS